MQVNGSAHEVHWLGLCLRLRSAAPARGRHVDAYPRGVQICTSYARNEHESSCSSGRTRPTMEVTRMHRDDNTARDNHVTVMSLENRVEDVTLNALDGANQWTETEVLAGLRGEWRSAPGSKINRTLGEVRKQSMIISGCVNEATVMSDYMQLTSAYEVYIDDEPSQVRRVVRRCADHDANDPSLGASQGSGACRSPFAQAAPERDTIRHRQQARSGQSVTAGITTEVASLTPGGAVPTVTVTNGTDSPGATSQMCEGAMPTAVTSVSDGELTPNARTPQPGQDFTCR